MDKPFQNWLKQEIEKQKLQDTPEKRIMEWLLKNEYPSMLIRAIGEGLVDPGPFRNRMWTRVLMEITIRFGKDTGISFLKLADQELDLAGSRGFKKKNFNFDLDLTGFEKGLKRIQ